MLIFLILVIATQTALVPYALRSYTQPIKPSMVLLPAEPIPFSYNFSTADSQAVFATVFTQYEEIKDWKPLSGYKVIVGDGVYYEFVFSDTSAKKSAAVSAFRRKGVTNIVLMDFLANVTLPIIYNCAWINPFPPSIEGFNSFTLYDNTSLIAALRQSVDQNPKVRIYHLSHSEFFASKQFYYFRLVFQQVPSSRDYVDLVQCIFRPTKPSYEHKSYISLDLNVNNIFYREAYAQIISAYPDFSNYKIVSVRKQVAFNENLEFVLLDSTPPLVKHVVLVSDNPFDGHSVRVLRRDYSVGYSTEAIEAVRFNAVEKWPQLSNYTLTKTSNIRSSPSALKGLRLIFESEVDSLIVEFDLNSQQETLVIVSS